MWGREKSSSKALTNSGLGHDVSEIVVPRSAAAPQSLADLRSSWESGNGQIKDVNLVAIWEYCKESSLKLPNNSVEETGIVHALFQVSFQLH